MYKVNMPESTREYSQLSRAHTSSLPRHLYYPPPLNLFTNIFNAYFVVLFLVLKLHLLEQLNNEWNKPLLSGIKLDHLLILHTNKRALDLFSLTYLFLTFVPRQQRVALSLAHTWRYWRSSYSQQFNRKN